MRECASSTKILQGGQKHADIISLTFWKILTKFHTRGYLKIKMSHDESVGNVLSWLGNWLRERKQPEPTNSSSNEFHMFTTSCPKRMDPSLNGGLVWQGAQNGAWLVFFSIFWKREFTVTFFSEAQCQVQRGKTLEDLDRIHVIKEMTDESECWQWSKGIC